MTTRTPQSILAAAVRAATNGLRSEQVTSLASRTDLDGRTIHRASKAIPVSVETHIKLCGILGIDPLSGFHMHKRAVTGFAWDRLASDLAALRRQRCKDMRGAAKEAGIGLATLFRIE